MNTTPDQSARPWLCVIAVALASFILITTELLPVAFLDRLAQAFHVPLGTAGLMVTISGLFAALAAPLSALLAGRIDRHFVLGASLVCVAGSNLLVAFARTFSIALLGRALLGVAIGIFWSFGVAVARRLVPEASGHRASTLVLAGVAVGTVVGVPVGSVLASTLGWRFAFIGAALVSLAIGIILVALMPRMVGVRSSSVGSMMRLFRIQSLSIGYAAIGLSAAGHFAAYTYLQTLLSTHVRLGASGLGWTLFGYGVAGAVGTYCGERAASVHLKHTFVSVLVGLAACVSLSCLVSNATCVLVFVILWGAFFGAIPVCTQIWTYTAAPHQFEAASAIGMTVFQFAVAAGSLCGGLVRDAYGLQASFLLGGVLMLLCAVLIASFREKAFLGRLGKISSFD